MSLGLYGLADHAVREALSRFGGLVVHALHADRGRFVPGLRGPVDHAVRGALPGLGGLVVHALHAVCGGRWWMFLGLHGPAHHALQPFAMHLLALAV